MTVEDRLTNNRTVMKKRDKIKAKYGGRCGYCGNILQDDWQVDHKTSRQYWPYSESSGTVNDEDNLIPACRQCNHYKREKMVESSGHHVGYRDYMLKFHIRLGKLPKKTQVERTKRRIEYMWCIANKYGITPDKPFNGVFWMDQYKTE